MALLLIYKYRGKNIKLNIDTAAQVSIISRRVAGVKNLRRRKYKLMGLGGAFKQGEFQVTDDVSTLYDGIIGLDVMKELQAKVDVGRLELVLRGSSYPLTLCTGGMLQGHVGMASLHANEAYQMTLHVARSQQIPAGEARIIYAKVPAADPQKALIVEE
jgi:hypothetical protein